ncbi:cysteine--1-D-myo-inosityl 2-amino-2-deoxy-alpha-D-glucopyranoside ligase [Kineococcus radiotolerans]|uniref:L-cysteine:1D-myo-inositol 2-amino-2-deoxy-alpha-D-glucopyranoside ligase n=1 Tax=Kineococcus radiotolerans (strain ATCC BAA-149 / DSM 14245 / SRS30216) TaxID=266940 RepID=MSHC_KINRD|nr:cysteine--1-D-myo-inosityl 2-amino-2-deoxy-alpha-D-glucopyranoside ligase [Kineococcus radiotolerans]A6W933.1 RecName: Full=L-cysteine:1D-myo-inositol 2-amino-2-deoxy-alpha-D-glucopyranoside ligase; Short=L-Cys:GlcN-Ins ligase; AltName: Full=Mycothiol ligase; Short=MSH ligase [Kineococcus radiotolerans SRS30216 = ATCC BAA-149]ABS03322.1 Cysteine--tRNA ligase [Kineococcus radiotolerans SRS30216 = ATCC BAA-149]
MRSWSVPEVPALPGRGPRVHLHDTATGGLVPVGPEAGTATLYVCGITPYDATHLGHANTYVAFDLLGRAWRDAGLDVRYVQNVTDVDDPLLERAEATGVDWRDLAESQVELFRGDMEALSVVPPQRYLGVVEAVDLVAEAVRDLLAAGAAYRVPGTDGGPDGDVYFPVDADAAFGTVGGYDLETMLALSAERGGDPQRPGKRNPLDPLLWRVERPGEPAWEAGELGRGRPGWHIECTAIALEHLGMPIDVQAGGSDLVFPHHEMGAAHAHLLRPRARPFARAYAHSGMVALDGEKMSKSKGNLVLVSRLVAAGVPAAVVRLAIVDHHWRTDWEWTDEVLAQARARHERWSAAVAAPAGPPAEALLATVRERLADDLDAPGAVAAVDAWVEQARTTAGTDAQAPDLVRRTVSALLGVVLP